MSWIDEWKIEINNAGKPGLDWVSGYYRQDGTYVAGHWRTEANETIADNLSTDVDKDGIAGFFDADADGDGILESVDLDNDGMADAVESLLDWLG